MNTRLSIAYVVVWLVCAAGSAALFWKATPQSPRRWYRTVSVVDIVVVGGMTLILFAAARFDPAGLAVCLAFLGFITWVAVFRTRVCGACGKMSERTISSSCPSSAASVARGWREPA